MCAESAVAAWARSGAMALTVDTNGVPSVRGAGAATSIQQSLQRLAVLTQQRTGVRAELPGVELLGERAAISGRRRKASGTIGETVGGATRTLPAADGWWALALPRATDLELVPALVESNLRAGDPWPTVAAWSASRSAVEVVDRAQLLGLAAARIPRGEADSDPQLEQRGGVPVVTTVGGSRGTRVAEPLVIDLSALWAGPLCAHLLGLTGARVVKVESTDRLDGARSGPAGFFDLLHAGHGSVAVDFRTVSGRAQLTALLDRADVVIDSARPRAMRQLGIDVADLVARGTIWTSITAYGREGPWSERVGFGDDVAAAAGLVADLDGIPVPVGDAIADPLAGAAAAAATAAALLADTGRLIDVSMRDVARAAATTPGSESEVMCSFPVMPPVARRAEARAAPPGADNDRYLSAAVAT